jgi:hypothetical protein
LRSITNAPGSTIDAQTKVPMPGGQSWRQRLINRLPESVGSTNSVRDAYGESGGGAQPHDQQREHPERRKRDADQDDADPPHRLHPHLLSSARAQ